MTGSAQILAMVALLTAAAVTARPADERQREARDSPTGALELEHRASAEDVPLTYYGGARGNFLSHQALKGAVPSWASHGPRKEKPQEKPQEKPEEEEEGDGQEPPSDGVAIQLPPEGASVAEARPVGLSIAGVGGVAASKPVATAVVGPGGLAISRPVATAIAGVPVGDIQLGGPGAAASSGKLPASSSHVALNHGGRYAVLPASQLADNQYQYLQSASQVAGKQAGTPLQYQYLQPVSRQAANQYQYLQAANQYQYLLPFQQYQRQPQISYYPLSYY